MATFATQVLGHVVRGMAQVIQALGVDRLGTLNATDAAAGDGRLPAGIGRGVRSGSLDGDAAEGEGEHAAVCH